MLTTFRHMDQMDSHLKKYFCLVHFVQLRAYLIFLAEAINISGLLTSPYNLARAISGYDRNDQTKRPRPKFGPPINGSGGDPPLFLPLTTSTLANSTAGKDRS